MRQHMQRLVDADESLDHQVVETFATVGESDLSWSERLWTSLFAIDGSLQIDLGIGKYANRNIMEGFAGISRGTEQWTVRASRLLEADPGRIGVGPIDHVVTKPFQAMTYRLGRNDVLPLEFDVAAAAAYPAFLEAPDRQREQSSTRISSSILRYHQALAVEGVVRVGDEEVVIRPDEWIGFRTHSWGVRQDVGEPPSDVRRADSQRLDESFFLFWGDFLMTRPDGTTYEIQVFVQRVDGVVVFFSAFENHPDGRQVPFHGMRDSLRFDPDNRRLRGGSLSLDAGWGATRSLEFEALGETGFHIGTGLYFGFRGRRHGQWMGESHLDGEVFEDCSDPAVAREVRQCRDTIVRVREGDAVGYGVIEPIVVGGFPEYGLTAESSFL